MASDPPRLIRLTETTSTNADALRLALSGEPLPLWVTAQSQSGGRGRSGRSWISDPGNLHASAAIRCHAPLSSAGQLALVAGLAAYDAVYDVCPLARTGLRLKWPNDVLIGTAKAGGILVESTTPPDSTDFLAILGFGLNIASAPSALGRAVTSLAAFQSVTPLVDTVLEHLIASLERWCAVWDNGSGFAAIRKGWLERAGPIGEAITVHAGDTLVSGTFAGLCSNGALLMSCGGVMREFNYGDVALVTDAATSETA